MPTRVIAIDWSGAAVRASKSIWLAEVADGRLIRLENGRDRSEITSHLAAEATRDPDLVVGLDFAFSLPAWFLAERQLSSAPELWNLVAREGERWLAECAAPFWGRPGRAFPGTADPYRRTELELAPVGGVRPKSVFQIGGAGAVGTGSLRGMPALQQLREAGFSVWPFDPPSRPRVVEIYPRVLTGAVIKSSVGERGAYLARAYPVMDTALRGLAAGSEDAFDAAVSALTMARWRDELVSLPPARDLIDRQEGRIWVPAVAAASGSALNRPRDSGGAGRSGGRARTRPAPRPRSVPGTDPGLWRDLVTSMLPMPVQVGQSGELVGGDPGEVVVRIEGGRLTVARFGTGWDGHTPASAHVSVADFDLAVARTTAVARAIARARADRIRRYQWCTWCREVNPPEWMHDAETCQGCAERELGVVY